jgi:hypothetical protein
MRKNSLLITRILFCTLFFFSNICFSEGLTTNTSHSNPYLGSGLFLASAAGTLGITVVFIILIFSYSLPNHTNSRKGLEVDSVEFESDFNRYYNNILLNGTESTSADSIGIQKKTYLSLVCDAFG